MKDYTSGWVGVAAAFIDHKRKKKELKAIQDANEANQGIMRYQPSQVEAFFNESDPLQNMFFSGGDPILRIRAMTRAAECGLIQGYTVLALHCGNGILEQALNKYFGSGVVATVNRANPIYDPFVGATKNDITRLTIASSTKTCQINAAGRYYLNGITDFIQAKGINPYIRMYITCPHMTLLDKVNDAEAKGQISANLARAITSQIMQGEVEKGNIEAFFAALSRQADSILAQKRDLNRAVNLQLAARNQQILCVDVMSDTNGYLINLLVNEVEGLLSQGNRVMLILDKISISANNVLSGFVKHSSTNCSMVVSADDVFSQLGGSDTDFFSFAGKCSKIIISKHASAYSCQKLSDTIGSYDKQEINTTYGANTNFVSTWGYGTTNTSAISIKRENIVKPEEIQRMNTDEVYIIDKLSGELSFTQVV